MGPQSQSTALTAQKPYLTWFDLGRARRKK
jgi:hypothetical protein